MGQRRAEAYRGRREMRARDRPLFRLRNERASLLGRLRRPLRTSAGAPRADVRMPAFPWRKQACARGLLALVRVVQGRRLAVDRSKLRVRRSRGAVPRDLVERGTLEGVRQPANDLLLGAHPNRRRQLHGCRRANLVVVAGSSARDRAGVMSPRSNL
jgi:hypothetical protein